MAETYKELGNVAPAANTNTLLYQCPEGKSAIVTAFTAGNTNATAVTFGYAVVDGDAGDLDADDWVIYGAPLSANNGFTSHNLTLAEGFSLVVRASATLVNFHAFGVEMDGVVGTTIAVSATVEDETSWGVTPAAGSSGTYSDGAHTHGTPANPVTFGTTEGTCCEGDDSRLSDTRDPNAHTHGIADVTDYPSEQTHIADPTGGTVQDSEARTAINSILDALIANGIIASS